MKVIFGQETTGRGRAGGEDALQNLCALCLVLMNPTFTILPPVLLESLSVNSTILLSVLPAHEDQHFDNHDAEEYTHLELSKLRYNVQNTPHVCENGTRYGRGMNLKLMSWARGQTFQLATIASA
jgi:hypothetical protein